MLSLNAEICVAECFSHGRSELEQHCSTEKVLVQVITVGAFGVDEAGNVEAGNFDCIDKSCRSSSTAMQSQ